jgi:hypothetical protein
LTLFRIDWDVELLHHLRRSRLEEGHAPQQPQQDARRDERHAQQIPLGVAVQALQHVRDAIV